MDMVNNVFDEGQIILVDKPIGWTSFDVVKKLKWLTKAKKVGHAGTLDPLATGLLILCTGKFTKRISEFQDMTKTYTGTFTLGSTTASYDLESKVEFSGEYANLKENDILESAAKFTGMISQIPPMYSAIKIDGVRAYKKARAGEEVVIKAREVMIHSFEIVKIDLPEVSFKVMCSKGTYIRSLARDFGQDLGCGAHLSSLRREQIGDMIVDEAKTPEEWAEILNSTQPN
jgi:tRNA pseudouridine55 synthase